MDTYLVTGGAGFIGSHLCDQLVKSSKVYVLDNLSTGCKENLPKEVVFIEGDICDYKLVKELMEQVDGCFHLAALVSVPLCNEDILQAHEINLSATVNILKTASELSRLSKFVPIVFASSCAVYGNSSHFPIKEDDPLLPISIYANTKLSGEYYGRFISEIYKFPFTALRLFNVYGARQKLDSPYSGVISIFLNNLLNDNPCAFYGSGEQSRDFVYVEDVILFFIKAMETSKHAARTYNVCSGKNIKIKTIAHLLSHELKKELVTIHKPPKIGDVEYSLGDPFLAGEELGIFATTSVESGLKSLVNTILRDLK
ncbi:NAD-dependent epimerase/dehydratase [Legionella sainthelensi]|uniref:NAD-dependent epimerase/dehydratase family protein n=1 Tax=Legionella sainthelensi TaxID=28087 RepID=UPI000F6D4211|nr:NAD-dependent epimerase/dehydratase family protein [Legionella sainthelensi]VEB33211.1 NAD-dependent epimerase/dehydratase [Legionella sainthelensi]